MTYADWVQLVNWFAPHFSTYWNIAWGTLLGGLAAIGFVLGWRR